MWYNIVADPSGLAGSLPDFLKFPRLPPGLHFPVVSPRLLLLLSTCITTLTYLHNHTHLLWWDWFGGSFHRAWVLLNLLTKDQT